MNILKKHLRDYLELRRGLGFELGRVESRLRSFVEFMKIKRARHITTKLAVEFALRSDRSISTQAGYLSAIRGFAQYLSGIEPKTEVPPGGLIRRGAPPTTIHLLRRRDHSHTERDSGTSIDSPVCVKAAHPLLSVRLVERDRHAIDGSAESQV